MSYFVYVIKIKGIVRYIGMTNDLVMREKQHNYLFSKGKKKILYDKIRVLNKDIKNIKIEMVKAFDKKEDAKRWECYLILADYFNKKQLWQRVPRISDV